MLVPLQIPLASQTLTDEPFKINPGSQVKCFVLGKTVKSPDDEPFIGAPKSPQAIASRK